MKSIPVDLGVVVNHVNREVLPVSGLDVVLIHQHCFLGCNEEAVKGHTDGKLWGVRTEEYKECAATRAAA